MRLQSNAQGPRPFTRSEGYSCVNNRRSRRYERVATYWVCHLRVQQACGSDALWVGEVETVYESGTAVKVGQM